MVAQVWPISYAQALVYETSPALPPASRTPSLSVRDWPETQFNILLDQFGNVVKPV